MRVLLGAMLAAALACGKASTGPPAAESPAPPSAEPPAPASPPPAGGTATSGPPAAFCWANAPQGGVAGAVWATRVDDAWVVGSPALALHWDGERWAKPPLATPHRVTSVWSSERGTTWMIAEDGALLRGGESGLREELPPGSAMGWVRGQGEDDVWAGERHWDGARWTLHSIDATPLPPNWPSARPVPLGDGTAFALYTPDLTPARACAWFDGAAWKTRSCPRFASRTDASVAITPWSSGHGDVWVAGVTLGPPAPDSYADFGPQTGQWLARWDGTSWSTDELPTTATTTRPILTGTGPNDLWFGAPDFRLDAGRWTAVEAPPSTLVDAVAVPGALLAADVRGVVSLRDREGSRALLDLGPMLAVGAAGGERIGVTEDRIFRLDGARWTKVADADASFLRPWQGDPNVRVFGEALEDLWVLHYAAGVHHWDGRRWAALAYPGTGRFEWGTAGSGRAWLVGSESIQIGPTSTFTSPLWVVERGAIARVAELGADSVSDVVTFASGETLALATRRLGPGWGPWAKVLWRHDGARWTEVWSGPTPSPSGWSVIPGATEADDVWVIADVSPDGGPTRSEVWRWDGATMARVGPLAGADATLAVVVRKGEAWLSVRSWTPPRTSFRALTSAGVSTADVAVLPAIARGIWVAPDGRVQVLSDAGAVWELGACAP